MNRFTTYPTDWRIKIAGAYIIVHRKTGRVYVGSSENLYQRKADHVSDLRHGNHRNGPLQQAYNDDSNIDFYAVVTGNLAEAHATEQDIMDRYAPLGQLFNLSLNAEVAFKGLSHTEEARERMSTAKKGHGLGVPKSPEHRARISASNMGRERPAHVTAAIVKARSRPVMIEGVAYSSVSEAARVFGVAPTTVCDRIASSSQRFANWNYDS